MWENIFIYLKLEKCRSLLDGGFFLYSFNILVTFMCIPIIFERSIFIYLFEMIEKQKQKNKKQKQTVNDIIA